MKASEIKVSYCPKVKASEQVKVTCSLDTFNFLNSIYENIDYCEKFCLILLSRANKILGFNWISSGGITGTVTDARMIFQIALKTHSVAVIIAHNHPSGNNRPSDSDINLTKKLKEAGKLLDITVLDHIILTSENYFSFADEGLI